MKKVFILFFMVFVALAGTSTPANSSDFLLQKKQTIQKTQEYKKNIKEIKAIIKKQDEFSNSYSYDGLYGLYSDDFINSDGFNKETYFKLIKDTWQSYPDISYSTVIKNINCSGNYATAEVTEKAVATSEEILSEDDIVTGELHSSADTIYYFKKSGSGWLISSEKILRETSSLTYGEARYTNIELSGPNQINAGEQYSALLTVDRPKNCVVVASLNQEKIVYPAQNAQDSFRKLSDDNTLERIFTSNKENVNEYVVASVALTRADASIYLSGLGFVMTRVNIIPENNSIKQEDENVESK